MYARFYAKTFNRVYAFEPDPISFHCMVNNTPYENVVKFNAAIGHVNKLIALVRPDEENIGMNVILDNGVSGSYIPMLTIDTLNLDACDLIQLDVEGFERQAIRGARNTIEKFKPVIIGERFNSPGNQTFMYELGYELKEMSSMDAIYAPIN
jgi:FkbM family methyltransferase